MTIAKPSIHVSDSIHVKSIDTSASVGNGGNGGDNNMAMGGSVDIQPEISI